MSRTFLAFVHSTEPAIAFNDFSRDDCATTQNKLACIVENILNISFRSQRHFGFVESKYEEEILDASSSGKVFHFTSPLIRFSRVDLMRRQLTTAECVVIFRWWEFLEIRHENQSGKF